MAKQAQREKRHRTQVRVVPGGKVRLRAEREKLRRAEEAKAALRRMVGKNWNTMTSEQRWDLVRHWLVVHGLLDEAGNVIGVDE